MLKEKLFKFLFPHKYWEYKDLQRILEKHVNKNFDYQKLVDRQRKEVEVLKKNVASLQQKQSAIPKATMADLMRDSLGLPMLTLSNVGDDGKPPHYLEGLTEEGRKDYIAGLESIYADERFQRVFGYVINLIGNHAMQKASDDLMRNGRIAIVGLRTLMAEFIHAHEEFVDVRKSSEEFDPLATMPE